MMEYLNIKKFIFYKKETTRSYIPINELCSILKKIILIKNFSGIYNISNKNLIFTFKKLEEEFSKKFKKKKLLKKVNFKPFITRSVIDNKKIMKRINYKQSGNFRQTKILLKFYKKVYCINSIFKKNYDARVEFTKNTLENYVIPHDVKDIFLVCIIEHFKFKNLKFCLKKIIKHLKNTPKKKKGGGGWALIHNIKFPI